MFSSGEDKNRGLPVACDHLSPQGKNTPFQKTQPYIGVQEMDSDIRCLRFAMMLRITFVKRK